MLRFHRLKKHVMRCGLNQLTHYYRSWGKISMAGLLLLIPLWTSAGNVPIRDAVIVIDPGHGGNDPGAIGFHGTHEKELTLAIAKKLAILVDEQPGMRAILTRKYDQFISLRGRLELAQQTKADIFIAIHADAYRNRTVDGVSVFVLSQRGASSEAARWLAAKENSADPLTPTRTKATQFRLLRIAQTKTQVQSERLAWLLLKSLTKLATPHRYRIEHAGFVVLKSPDIPSVLVETGFISNYLEEAHLRNPNYQQKIAESLFEGIEKYLLQHPPTNTIFAILKYGTIDYFVKSGDSLSGIAKRYHTTITVIRKINGLTNDRLTRGQLLKIPKK